MPESFTAHDERIREQAAGLAQPRPSLIYDQARQRVERQLRKLWELMGPLSLGELSDMMDGAQDAVREWMPPVRHPAAELVSGRIPEHLAGAYPSLSCCGGTKVRLVPSIDDQEMAALNASELLGPAMERTRDTGPDDAGAFGLGRCQRCGESFRSPDAEKAETAIGIIHVECRLDGEQLA